MPGVRGRDGQALMDEGNPKARGRERLGERPQPGRGLGRTWGAAATHQRYMAGMGPSTWPRGRLLCQSPDLW